MTNKESAIFIIAYDKTRQDRTFVVEGNRPERLLPLPDQANRALAFGRSKPLWLIDTESGKTLTTFKDDVEHRPVVSPDGATVLHSYVGTLRWSKTEDGATIREKDNYLDPFAFSPDGKLVYAGGSSREDDAPYKYVVTEVDAETAELNRTFGGHQREVSAAAVSPDGKWLATGGQDAHVCLFDLADGKLVHRVLAQEGPVTQTSFSSDAKWLVSVGREDQSVALWKMGEEQPTWLDGH